MVSTLASYIIALKGLVVLSSELEAMGNACVRREGGPRRGWAGEFPSLSRLPLWYADLLKRLEFMQGWIDNGQ